MKKDRWTPIFSKPVLPTYKRASKEHKELIDRILSVKDFCLAMPDTKDRERLTVELMDKIVREVKKREAFARYVMVVDENSTIFGGKFFSCDGVSETSYNSNYKGYNTLCNEVDDIKLVIINNLELSNLQIWQMAEIKNIVNLLRQKNKDVKVLFIVNDLFVKDDLSFYNMFSILNLNVAKLNQMLEREEYEEKFLKRNKTGDILEFQNMKALEVLLKKHLYIDPLLQVRRMDYKITKEFEITEVPKCLDKIIQNTLEFNAENKKLKHSPGKTPLGNYSKYLNIIVDKEGTLLDQREEKKHYYYKNKDVKVFNEHISNGRFSKSSYELHTVETIWCPFIERNKNNIKTIHIVANVKEEFIETFFRAVNILYNGDYSDNVRLFIYFVSYGIGNGCVSKLMLDSFNFENIEVYRKLELMYRDIKSNIKIKSDDEKTFEEIMREILGENYDDQV